MKNITITYNSIEISGPATEVLEFISKTEINNSGPDAESLKKILLLLLQTGVSERSHLKIPFIKVAREFLGCGLTEAKNWVEKEILTTH